MPEKTMDVTAVVTCIAGVHFEDSLLSSLTRQIKSSSSVFYLPSRSQLLLTNSSRPATLASILSPSGRRGGSQSSWRNPLPVELLENVTMDATGDLPTAPVINFEPGNSGSGDVLQLELPLDVVCVLGIQTPVEEVAEKLKEGVCSQIKAIVDAMRWQVCSVLV